MGGLIQDANTTTESGIPILHRIPLVDKLFGQTRDEVRRTELLVMILPKRLPDTTYNSVFASGEFIELIACL